VFIFPLVTLLMSSDVESILFADKEDKLCLYRRIKWARDAALGMNWLHKLGIVHRDLKPDNMLWEKKTDTVKITDLGLSLLVRKTGGNFKDHGITPPMYLAPEVALNNSENDCSKYKDITNKCDVFSYGISLAVFMKKAKPYEFTKNNQPTSAEDFMIRMVIQEGYRPFFYRNYPESLLELCESCWQTQAQRRPSFEDIIPMLNDILVDCAIQDEKGRKFWKDNYIDGHMYTSELSTERHDEFALDFLTSLDPKPSRGPYDVEVVKSLFVKSHVINVQQFGRVLQYFPPLSKNWLEAAQKMVEQPWFFGQLTQSKANFRLIGCKEGTYLARYSTSAPGRYTISYVGKDGKIIHTLVKFKKNKFCVKKLKENTLEDLIKAIPELKVACSENPFQSLYQIDLSVYQQNFRSQSGKDQSKSRSGGGFCWDDYTESSSSED